MTDPHLPPGIAVQLRAAEYREDLAERDAQGEREAEYEQKLARYMHEQHVYQVMTGHSQAEVEAARAEAAAAAEQRSAHPVGSEQNPEYIPAPIARPASSASRSMTMRPADPLEEYRQLHEDMRPALVRFHAERAARQQAAREAQRAAEVAELNASAERPGYWENPGTSTIARITPADFDVY
jgi:hypothetical protein